jgi:hypothetical protein
MAPPPAVPGNATLAVAWLLRATCRWVLLDLKPAAVCWTAKIPQGGPNLVGSPRGWANLAGPAQATKGKVHRVDPKFAS